MNETAVGALFSLFFLVPVFLLSLPVLFVLQEALVDGLTSRARRHVSRQPLRMLLLGLVNFVFFFGLAAVLGDRFGGLVAALALLILLALLFLAVGALGVMAGLVGDRVAVLWARPETPASRTIVGGFILESLVFVPVVGWLVLVGMALAGLGGLILGLWRRGGTEMLPDVSVGEDVQAGS